MLLGDWVVLGVFAGEVLLVGGTLGVEAGDGHGGRGGSLVGGVVKGLRVGVTLGVVGVLG